MNNLKTMLVNKKNTIGIVVAVLLIGGVGGYFIYDNNRKNEILGKMSISFTDVKEIEYGTKDYDVKKELIKEIKNCELIGDVPKLDTTKVGEVTLKFTLSKSDVTKEVEHKVSVVDTKAPEITLEADSKDLIVGDEYDIKTNITGVKDVIDGDISLNEKANEVNKKATEEYSKLKKEEITDETKVADKKLDDFLIETIKGDDEKETTQLFLKNCYYVDGSVDVATAGEYTVNVVAVDKNGIKSTKEFVVNVKEKPKEEKAPVVNNGGGSSSSGGGYTSNSGGGSSSGGGSVAKQGISAVINSALSQVGTSYVWGGSAPGGFDCSGLIAWAFNSNGYSVPRAVNGAGSSIGTNLANAQAGDILAYSGHSNLITSVTPCGEDEGMTVYNFSYVTAVDGIGVVSKHSPTIIRQDGKVLQGSQDWYDIRRVR